jgi:hypothetical protein
MEQFFDLKIATIRAGEEPPPDAHWVRIPDPWPRHARDYARQGWFYKPSYVTYVLPVPLSLNAYIESAFPSPARSKPRKLLRDVPRRYSLLIESDGRHLPEFKELYRRTIVARPRGKDRVAEHDDGFDRHWLGFYLFHADRMAAGVLVHAEPGHLSVSYGAFDPDHRKLDLEHYLLMQVLERSIERRDPLLSLGMDTNRYGHHLSLYLPAYKLRLGFTPLPYEPAGRELVRIQSFAPFEKGLFFYAYDGDRFIAHYFSRTQPDLRPFQHRTSPPIRVHPIE